jgi:hypothetical protein
MSDAQDELPAEFDDCVNRWRQADQDVRVALERYRAAPNAVNRLAIDVAWAAIEPSLNELSGWAVMYPGSRAVRVSIDAQARWKDLQDQITQAVLSERWGG